MAPFTAQVDCIEMFRSDWMKENIKFGHGPLMSKYGLWGDGTYYHGEPDIFQYGTTQLTLNWGFDGMPEFKFNPYDHLGEGDSSTYVLLFDVGLRGLENGNYGTLLGRVFETGKRPEKGYDFITGKEGTPNLFARAYQEDWAARAEWCIKPYEECNHAPIVSTVNGNINAAPGEAVRLEGSASDPDGDQLKSVWYVYRQGSKYSGTAGDLRVWEPMHFRTRFTVPSDAKPGDYFNLILEVQDDAKKPMTRYSQVIVHVTDTKTGSAEAESQKFDLASMFS
jgi:hypothetical protein